MSKQSIPLLTLALVATGTIAANRFVTAVVAQAGANDNTIGVTRTAASSGDCIPVDVLGTVIVETGAAVVKGDTLESDSSGRGVPWSTSGAKIAVALEAASASGAFIEVLLIPNAA